MSNININQLKNITLPRRLFTSMLEAYQKWEKVSDELEGFLLSCDDGFIKKMKTARSEHLKGETRSLDSLKQELK